jgi:hypothetical protein
MRRHTATKSAPLATLRPSRSAPQNRVLNRFTPAFLLLPENAFLNIIFCSLPESLSNEICRLG